MSGFLFFYFGAGNPRRRLAAGRTLPKLPA